MLRTDSEAVVIAICRCLPPARRLMKIKAWPSVSIMWSWKISHHSSSHSKAWKPEAKLTGILCINFTVCTGMLSCWSILTKQGMSCPCAVKLLFLDCHNFIFHTCAYICIYLNTHYRNVDYISDTDTKCYILCQFGHYKPWSATSKAFATQKEEAIQLNINYTLNRDNSTHTCGCAAYTKHNLKPA